MPTTKRLVKERWYRLNDYSEKRTDKQQDRHSRRHSSLSLGNEPGNYREGSHTGKAPDEFTERKTKKKIDKHSDSGVLTILELRRPFNPRASAVLEPPLYSFNTRGGYCMDVAFQFFVG